jgi:hypothetical protein
MAPKGGNTKKESGRAKKAENEANKRAAGEESKVHISPSIKPSFLCLNPIIKERTEADKWADGSKSAKGKEEKEERRKAELARKAENARLLAEEEASTIRAKKAAPKGNAKKGKPAGPGAIAAEGELSESAQSPVASSAENPSKDGDGPQEVESFAATGIDNAIDLLEVVTAKMDKASIGNQAAGIEKHPEVCNFALLVRLIARL